MARIYYTLCKFDTDANAWFDEFGSYDRAEVKEELQFCIYDGAFRSQLTIVRTDGSAAQLVAALAKLNAPLRKTLDELEAEHAASVAAERAKRKTLDELEAEHAASINGKGA